MTKTGGIVLILATALAGCATSDNGATVINADREYEFSLAHTFSWLGESGLIPSSTGKTSKAVAEVLATSILAGLQDRGLKFVKDATDADLVVAYTVGTREMLKLDKTHSGYYRRNWNSGARFVPNIQSHMSHIDTAKLIYTSGSLSIDVFDAVTRKLVWQGNASKPLTATELAGNSKKSTAAAVSAILVNFPPTE